ncbi:Creatinase/aminopeptidase [Ascobolus immersus RN42]|uniref:Xaa-Pro aminopeptidase n=1 Tax=Ascobolus immersus RN42 TaxID=1160509 RepID=A0A3N4HGF5_ASCIM|nr:Creatinase/aminopeptidase [Ascobolus immersus RN42]
MDPILNTPYPARAHAKAAAAVLKQKIPNLTSGLIYLESTKEVIGEDDDHPVPFRQRRNFYYLTGCDLHDSYVTYDLSTEKLTLYIPPLDAEEVMWMGLPVSPEEALQKYDVDEVRTTEDVTDLIDKITTEGTVPVFTIKEQVSNTKLLETLETINTKALVKEANLQSILEELRTVKDKYEVALIRHANKISTLAHETLMAQISTLSTEQQAEGLFTGICIQQGAPKQAYHGIFAAGEAAATLHYVHNNKPFDNKNIILVDAGAEFRNYASDITRCYPIKGEFSPESLAIYKLVLEMQNRTISELKAGIRWEDLHLLAHRVLIEGLQKIGIFKSEFSVDEILESRVSCAFLPHGLGHFLGMDTHDKAGKLPGHKSENDTDPIFKYLRIRRTLPVRSVVTIEPGCYFCPFIVNPYLENEKYGKYVDKEVLSKYWAVGGVRIEDNLLVLEEGSENLTDTKKSVEQVLKVVRGE